MPQCGDQPFNTVTVRELKFTGFETASCYTRLSWELDIKLEKGKKGSQTRETQEAMLTASQLPIRRCRNQFLEEHFKDISFSQHSPASSLLSYQILSLKSLRFPF